MRRRRRSRATPLAPATAVVNLTKSGKKRYAKLPMTEEEEEKLLDVRARHRSVSKEMSARVERRKELFKRRDEILFQRRCLAARLTNRILVLRTDAADVRHQRLVGWKIGKPMPEEIINARNRISWVLVLFSHICKALEAGLDAFIDDYQQRKRACQELVQTECLTQGEVQGN